MVRCEGCDSEEVGKCYVRVAFLEAFFDKFADSRDEFFEVFASGDAFGGVVRDELGEESGAGYYLFGYGECVVAPEVQVDEACYQVDEDCEFF